MKLVSFNHDGKDSYGAVLDGGVLDLSGAFYQEFHFGNLREVFSAGAGALTELKRLIDAGAATLDLSDVKIRMPIHNPSKIFCVGRNYYAYHEVKEDGRPEWPSIFPRFPDSFSAHDEAVIRGKDDGNQLDYEGELVVVIGEQGRHIAEADAMSYVGGYTIANEGSVRNWIGRGTQNCPVKNQWRSGSMGPWIVTVDEITDPMNLPIKTRVNGEVRQEGNTRMMIFDIPFVISYISRFTQLEPGDLICTGSPGGSAIEFDPPRYLKPGDILEVEIEPIGTLQSPIEAE
ncbi:fumarylacetoacetate hydrolase family protein [Alphaproteobacteria bacterium]|nr:fumarylacetoacetate hydrolase family protein [Alphaproteobacteria bacterium]